MIAGILHVVPQPRRFEVAIAGRDEAVGLRLGLLEGEDFLLEVHHFVVAESIERTEVAPRIERANFFFAQLKLRLDLGLRGEGGRHLEVARLIDVGAREARLDQHPEHFVRPIRNHTLEVARQDERGQMKRLVGPEHRGAEHQRHAQPERPHLWTHVHVRDILVWKFLAARSARKREIFRDAPLSQHSMPRRATLPVATVDTEYRIVAAIALRRQGRLCR